MKNGDRVACIRAVTPGVVYFYGFGSVVGAAINDETEAPDVQIKMDDEAGTLLFAGECYVIGADRFPAFAKDKTVKRINPAHHRVAQARMKEAMIKEVESFIERANGGPGKDKLLHPDRMGMVQSTQGEAYVVASLTYTRKLNEVECAAMIAMALAPQTEAKDKN